MTLSDLPSLDGVEGQLQSHIDMGKNTGITENQLAQLADLIQETVNRSCKVFLSERERIDFIESAISNL